MSPSAGLNSFLTGLARLSALHLCAQNTYETARAVYGMSLQKALTYLEAVLAHKRCIPFRRFNSNIGRTAQAKEFAKHTTAQGRWPTKSCKILLELLKNAEANAENKQLETNSLYVSHVCVQRARCGRRRTYRAHGRINPYMSHPCHVEIYLKQKEDKKEPVTAPPLAGGKKVIRMSRKQLARTRLRIGGGAKQEGMQVEQ
eukprot:GHVU01150903.1.p1 GENE.GHVU01150903.1~~GHVU01150903.1.p1  ORF type:complete len:201 (+),score=24.32 GHVU01150903.1:552-1154(+)